MTPQEPGEVSAELCSSVSTEKVNFVKLFSCGKRTRRWRYKRGNSPMAVAGEFTQVLAKLMASYDSGLKIKDKQEEALRAVWTEGRDVLISLPTGYGKSLKPRSH